MQPGVETKRQHFSIIILLFVASVLLSGVISWFEFEDYSVAGLRLFCCPLFFALPTFAVLTWLLRKKGKLGTVLPLLVLPLLFILTLANNVYEKNPQYMFKTYVVNPIPAGVTNIQGRYLEGGLTDALITFQASPGAVETIIVQNHLERHNFQKIDSDLPERSWKGNWIGYDKGIYKQSGGLAGWIHMWVDTEQSTVIFRYQYSGW